MAGVRVQRLPHRLAVSHEVKLRKHLLLTIKPTNCESHSYKTLKTRSLPTTYIHTRLLSGNIVRSSINSTTHLAKYWLPYPRGQQFHRMLTPTSAHPM